MRGDWLRLRRKALGIGRDGVAFRIAGGEATSLEAAVFSRQLMCFDESLICLKVPKIAYIFVLAFLPIRICGGFDVSQMPRNLRGSDAMAGDSLYSKRSQGAL